MRTSVISLLVLFFAVQYGWAIDTKKDQHTFDNLDISPLENVHINNDNGTLVITPEDYDGDFLVEISPDRDLYVNGLKIELSPEQQKWVDEYYALYMDIEESALEVAKEGARIGAEGAALGMKAVSGVFKLLRADYDGEDLDAEMELASKEIELKAEQLEMKAEHVEKMADTLEKRHKQMKEAIPALRDLDSF